jgi:predicted CoA-binding protein
MSPTYGGSGEGWKNPSFEEIDRLLRESKTIAVVGLSPDPSRPSAGVASYLKRQGYTIIPVNPKADLIIGEKAYSDLRSVPVAVDIVEVFRKSEEALSITEEAIAINARAVWLQEGVVSPEAFRRGEEAGLIMIMDKCMAREHARMIRG